MSENVRRRRSKWDLISETSLPGDTGEHVTQPSSTSNTNHGSLNLDGNSSEQRGTQVSNIISDSSQILKPSESESRHVATSRDDCDLSKNSKMYDVETDRNWEPIFENRAEQKDGKTNRSPNLGSDVEAVNTDGLSWNVFCEKRSERKDNVGWGTSLGESYNTSLSPSQNTRRPRSRSASPKNERSKPRRSYSRSRSRSRSRSPHHSFRQEVRGWNDRNRSGVSLLPCRDFAAGRCRKGSQCRYPHEEGGRTRRQYEKDNHDPVKGDTKETRYERGRPSGNEKEDHLVESMERRECSRDRLPYRHGSLYDEDREKHDFHRSSRSTERCLNFMRGRCQKGAACRYVHHDASHDGESYGNNGSRDRINDRGEFDVSKHDHRYEHRRTYDTPCKFFAEGRCRNGENCKFSHQETTQSHPEHNRPQTTPSQNLEDVKYQLVPKHAPQIVLPDQKWNMGHKIPNQLDQGDPIIHPQHTDKSVNFQQHSILEGGTHRDENLVTINSSESQTNAKLSHTNKQPGLAPIPVHSFSHFDQSQYTAPQPPNNQILKPPEWDQQVACPTSFSDKNQQQGDYSLTPTAQNLSSSFINSTNAQISSFNGQNQLVPLASHNGEGEQNIYSLPSNGQGQFASLPKILNMQNFDTSKQCQDFNSSPPKSHLNPKSPLEESTLNLNMLDRKTSDVNSGNSINNKVVTSEQIAQITNLSASLAQIFGNGQQLPQLYAALNPPSSVAVMSSHLFSQPNSVIPPIAVAAPIMNQLQHQFINPISAAPLIQSDSRLSSEQLHEYISESMEPSKGDNKKLPTGTSVDSVKQNTGVQEIETALTQAPFSVTDLSRSTGENRFVDLDGKIDNTNHELKQLEMSGGETGEMNGMLRSENKKRKQTEQTEEIDTGIGADGDGKRNKDVKGIRMFKHALVEFVKDLLKPTWKEGNMSKEAHKTIVKKVVDKVSGALQSNIPQTQEKIDLYLSHSKPKLSKLVQAYVEKYSKI